MTALLFVVPHSTEAPDRATTALRTAAAAAGSGHDVAVWLTGEGVRLGVKGVAETFHEPGEPSATEALETVVRAGGALHVDRPSFEQRKFKETSLRAGARLAASEDLARLLAEGRLPLTL